MDVAELENQLDRHAIADNTPEPVNGESLIFENRRLTRSKTLPNSNLPIYSSPYREKKTAKRTLSPEDAIKGIYLDNKVKITHKYLETIFEDPVIKRGNTQFIGAGKQKRSLQLDREFRIITKQKSKIRKMKIKRLGKVLKPTKMSQDEFQAKMMSVDSFLNNDEMEVVDDNISTCINNNKMQE